MADPLKEFVADFVHRFGTLVIHGEDIEDSERLPADLIHELDQETARLTEQMRFHGIDPRDAKVAATLAFVCSSIFDIVAEAVEEHEPECHYDGNCDVSAVAAQEGVQDFSLLLGMVVKQAL